MPSLSVRLPRPRLTRRRLVISGVVLALVLGVTAWAAWPRPASYLVEDRMLTVRTGPTGDVAVTLDTTLYLPKTASSRTTVPAILLAHGFGGTKRSVTTDAKDLADLGYAVLTWTAQGFGRSSGQIHLDSPDWEVKDAQRLLDWLAARPDITKDGPNDPRVAAVGGSYGGGLALMLAGQDPRVDAIVPMIAWNDLARSFLPEATGQDPIAGVFKKQWAGLFFGSGGTSSPGLADLAAGAISGGAASGGTSSGGAPTGNPSASAGAGGEPGASGGSPAGGSPAGGRTEADTTDPQCGRFARDVCAAYLAIATTGRATPEAITLLRRSSPATVLSRITAPTLLIQGQADSLFPLSEGDANARGIAANGTPVRVAWFTGGHDGGAGPQSDQDRLRFLTAQWLDHYVKRSGAAPARSFTYSRITGIDATNRGLVASGFAVTDYPGVTGTTEGQTVTVVGPPQPIANPPNGTPSALTSLGAAGGLSSFLDSSALEVPGQHADYFSEPLQSTVDVVGAPDVRVRVAAPGGSAVVFVKLYDVDRNGSSSLPSGLVAPVRLSGLPATIDSAQPITVTLPAIVHRFERGHRMRITIASSDQAFATPVDPTVYAVGLDGASSAVHLPTVAATPIASPSVIWRYVLVGLVAAIVLGLALVLLAGRLRHRRRRRSAVAEFADTPLVIRGLRKTYSDGFVALSSVDFTVQRGQVVGLLGPNGAGKTTALRVLMGLITATAGEVLVFGHRLTPGAEVLSRLGALVEGPGFLPHLSGLANLRLYWRSTGRPAADARLDEALEIAGLGSAINRKVKAYSHGMKQRLAIAQAMLGMPELLVLDEPTDGLDPPQIAEMRRVLNRYATDGRAVLVSSHLLAEVEQTCTDVVVMNRGEIVASGPVAEIVGDSPTVQLDVSDVAAAEAVLGQLAGVQSVAVPGGGALVVDVNGTPRADVVAALVRAGVGVDRVVPRRRLEDAFLALVADEKAGARP